jgi:hypothetical protein
MPEPTTAPPLEEVTMAGEFPCPKCGASDWQANYMVPASQSIELFLGANGEIEFGEYGGDEEYFDADSDTSYTCRHCYAEIDPDGKLIAEVSPEATVPS